MSPIVIVMSIHAIAMSMFSLSHSSSNTIGAGEVVIKQFVNSVFCNAFSTMIKIFKFVNSSIRYYCGMGKDSSFNSSICH